MQEKLSPQKLSIVIAGHVDHGKSTLIGRLLFDTGSFADGKHAELVAACARRGVPFEWSFLLDAFQAERDQAITIDTTQVWFKSQKRPYAIIDAPGHAEFLKNMISGAAFADAAILVVDAKEGVREQTKRHAFLLHLLGLKNIIVALNKMDAVGYDEAKFRHVSAEIGSYLAATGLAPRAVIPLAARNGENIVAQSGNMPWHKGPALLDALDAIEQAPPREGRPLRFPVQDVYRFDETRIIAGRIESGRLRKGDELLFSPAGRAAKVVSIEKWNAPHDTLSAEAGECIGVTLDRPVFVERGDVGSHADRAPLQADAFRATVFWLGSAPLAPGNRYKIKLSTREAAVTAESINCIIDTADLSRRDGSAVEAGQMAEVTFRSRELLALDPYGENPALGRVVILDGSDVAGGGIVLAEGLSRKNLYAAEHLLNENARARLNGHSGAVIWLTGLSASGKSTLAMRAEHALHVRGFQAYVLDGDNVRRGLCADLGFSAEDRNENVRRVGEAAALMADAGLIVIAALISPFRATRDRARAAAGAKFHEIYIDASLATCEMRDPKGLYKKARRGEIADFTGISSPYEAPENPELVIDTATQSIDRCVEQLVAYIRARVQAEPQDASTRSA